MEDPANAFSHPLLAKSVTVPINQRADLDSNTMLFSRSGFLLTPEEFSPWASLMARELPLGPSDAPCSKETSTAHGDSLFSMMLLHTRITTALESSVSVPDCAHNLLLLNLLTSELNPSPPFSSKSPISRRSHIATWPVKAKLGFSLKGLEPTFGPLALQRPNAITRDSCLNDQKLRSVTPSLLSICSQCLGRSLKLNGRRHHLREKSSSLLWFFNHVMRTLELVLNMDKTCESKSLKVYCLLFSTPTCRRDDGGYRLSTATIVKDFKHQPNANVTKLQSNYYSPHCVLDLSLSDFKTAVNRSYTVALHCFQSLVPARNTSLAPSLTSPRLLTGTILPPIDLFVEACSTNRDLTCAKTLSSVCLKALMEPMSILFIYRLLALGNTLLCNVLNYGIFAPIFSMYLIFI